MATKKPTKQSSKRIPEEIRAIATKDPVSGKVYRASFGIYIDQLPKAVPAGWILVHNPVRPRRKNQSPNADGFRCWLTAPDSKYEVCDCGWAPQMGEHFRGREAWRNARIGKTSEPKATVKKDDDYADAYRTLGSLEGTNACLGVIADIHTDNKGGVLKRALGDLYEKHMNAKERSAALEGFCWAVERQLLRGAKGLPKGWDKPPFKELQLGDTSKRKRTTKQGTK